MTTDVARRRIAVIAIIVAMFFGVLLVRLWFLQVLSGPTFAEAAQRNHVRVVWIESPRGRILDRKGRVLVKNRTALAVAIRREDMPKSGRRRRAMLTEVASIAGVPLEQVQRRLADKRAAPFQPVVVAEDIPMRAYFELNERQWRFPGLETIELPVRDYPHGALGAHVLGYVNEITEPELERLRGYRLGDSIGRTGIERQYEPFLRGQPELRKIEVDASGREVGRLGGSEGTPGRDVQLTLDLDIQKAAERALADGIARARGRRFTETGRRFRAPAGAAVVLDAKTGGVVAMASYPTFDLRRFVGGVSEDYYRTLTAPQNDNPLLNRAVQAAYPPGSTFKPIIALAALTSGTGSPSGGYPCMTQYRFGDRVFRNWRPRNATISIAQSLVESCDTVYYHFARTWWLRERNAEASGRRPYEIMQDWSRRFGLGKPTGIDLPDRIEASGRIPDRAWRRAVWEANKDDYCARYRQTRDVLFEDLCERGYLWRGGDSLNMSIGQGDVQTTPLQMAVVYAAVANGGSVVTPYVGARVLGPDGKPQRALATKPAARLDIPAADLRYVQRALVRVATDGTAQFPYRAWPLDRVPMAAKTGSAEIAGKQPFSWFASYGPANDPRYVVVAVVEEAGSGSQVAGPVVRRIMDELFGRDPLPIVFGQASD